MFVILIQVFCKHCRAIVLHTFTLTIILGDIDIIIVMLHFDFHGLRTCYNLLSFRIYLFFPKFYFLFFIFGWRINAFKSYWCICYRLFIILQSPNTFVMVVQIQGSCLKYLIMSRYVSLFPFLLVIYMDVSFMLVYGHISIPMNKGTCIWHIV